MLKTNSKQAAENVRAYICKNFDFFNYADYTEDPVPKTFPEIAALILSTFRDEKYSRPESFRYYHGIEREAFVDWCSGLPSVLDTCYFYNRSAVDDLGAILEDTEAEKAKYTEYDAENILTDLIYRQLLKGEKINVETHTKRN